MFINYLLTLANLQKCFMSSLQYKFDFFSFRYDLKKTSKRKPWWNVQQNLRKRKIPKNSFSGVDFSEKILIQHNFKGDYILSFEKLFA